MPEGDLPLCHHQVRSGDHSLGAPDFITRRCSYGIPLISVNTFDSTLSGVDTYLLSLDGTSLRQSLASEASGMSALELQSDPR
jgi:hypothetical protein